MGSILPPLPTPPQGPGGIAVQNPGVQHNQALQNPNVLPYRPNPVAGVVGGLGMLLNAARAHEKQKESEAQEKGFNILKMWQLGLVHDTMLPEAYKLLVKGKVFPTDALKGPDPGPLSQAAGGGQAPQGAQAAPAAPPQQGMMDRLQGLGRRMGVLGPQMPQGMDPNSPLAMGIQRMQEMQMLQRMLAGHEAKAQIAGTDARAQYFDTLSEGIKNGNDPQWMAKNPLKAQLVDHVLGEPSNYRVMQEMVSRGDISKDDAQDMFLNKAFGQQSIKQLVYDTALKNSDRWGGDAAKGMRYTAASMGPKVAKMFGMTPDEAKQVANDPSMRPQMTIDDKLKVMGAVRDTLGQVRVPEEYRALMTNAALGAAQGSQDGLKIVGNGMQAFGRANDEYAFKKDAAGLDRQRFNQSLEDFNFQKGKFLYDSTKDTLAEQWNILNNPDKFPTKTLDTAAGIVKDTWRKQGTMNIPFKTTRTDANGNTTPIMLNVPVGGDVGDIQLDRDLQAIPFVGGKSNWLSGDPSFTRKQSDAHYDRFQKAMQQPQGPQNSSALDTFIQGLSSGLDSFGGP